MQEFLKHFEDTYFMLFHDPKGEGMFPVDLKQNFDKQEVELRQKQGYGVFFSINRFPSKRKKDECKGINAWAIDIDDEDIPKYIQKRRIDQSPLKPSFVIESKNGYHLYWLAENGSIEGYDKILNRLISYYDGDANAKDITRVLRVPGYNHCKDPQSPFQIKLIDENPVRYSETTMLATYKEAQIVNGNFWEEASKLSNEDVLMKLSGTSDVKNETFAFDDNANGTRQITVNGKRTSCWLDKEGKIGSSDNGGPTFVQWLGWYGHSKADIVQILKTNGLVKVEEKPKEVVKEDKFDGDIYEHNNCYFQHKWDNKGAALPPIKLTNFILKTVNIFKEYATNVFIREYMVHNEHGEVRGPFKVYPDDYSGFADFKRFFISRGHNFLVFAPEKTYPKLLEFIFFNSKGFKEINLIPNVGYIDKFKIWLFNNFAIDKEGEMKYTDENGIIWIKDKGYRSVNADNDGDNVHTSLTLKKDDDLNVNQLERKFIDGICMSYGTMAVKIAMGWLYANVHAPKIMKKYGLFPLLWINGKTRSGKDVLSSWLLSVFGLDNSSKESLPQMTSSVGIARKASYYSYLPLALDEYNNTFKIRKHDGFFKNLATKTGVTKGTKRMNQRLYEPIYSNFIFTSEALSEEPALLNRSVILRLNPNQRDDSYYDDINEDINNYFHIGVKWMKGRKENEKYFFQKVKDLKAMLISKRISAFTAELYAIVGAGYLCVEKNERAKKEFEEVLVQHCRDSHKEKESTDKLSQFWVDLETVHASKSLKGNDIATQDENGHVYFWVKYAFDAWLIFKKQQGKDPESYKAIYDLLKETKACVNFSVHRNLDGKPRRCMQFKTADLTIEAKQFFDNAISDPLHEEPIETLYN